MATLAPPPASLATSVPSEFVPPYPYRFPAPPPAWRRLMVGRRNFVAMWEEGAFELEFSASRLLMRQTFLCNSPDSVRFAFNAHNSSFERKAPQMRHALEPLIGDGLFISDGPLWKGRRRMIAPIIHQTRLAQFAPIMVETIVETRDRWTALATPTIDALGEMAHLTAEVIARTVFGRELGRAHTKEVVEGFTDYQTDIGQIDPISLLGLPEWIPRFHGPRVHRARRRIHAVLDGIVNVIKTQRSTGDDSLIAQLLDATDADTGQLLTAEAVRNEAAVLFMAGHETTANTLAWVWYLLSQAPDVEARLHAEVDAVLGGRLPSLADVPNLVFVRAVIDEALRLYPPVPILPREAVVDEHYQGFAIPKGSLVFVVPWLLHRHKRLWEKPDTFDPDRFMPQRVAAIPKYAYVPFSIGPRVCAGLAFGLTEAILSVATLAQKFRLRMPLGQRVEPVCRLTLRPQGGLRMQLEPRVGALLQTHAKPPHAGPRTAGRGACPYHPLHE
jgi:cytochrome P450